MPRLLQIDGYADMKIVDMQFFLYESLLLWLTFFKPEVCFPGTEKGKWRMHDAAISVFRHTFKRAQDISGRMTYDSAFLLQWDKRGECVRYRFWNLKLHCRMVQNCGCRPASA